MHDRGMPGTLASSDSSLRRSSPCQNTAVAGTISPPAAMPRLSQPVCGVQCTRQFVIKSSSGWARTSEIKLPAYGWNARLSWI